MTDPVTNLKRIAYTIDEVLGILPLSRGSIYNAARAGKLRIHRPPGVKKSLILAEDLERFIATFLPVDFARKP